MVSGSCSTLPTQSIPAEADRIFATLADKLDYLRGRDADAFSAGLPWVWAETTVLHPFRDVNSRSQWMFFTQLAEAAGWVIDWRQIDPYVFAHARTVAIAADQSGIEALIRPALRTATDVQRDDELRDRMRQAERAFFAPQPPRARAQLDTELQHALKERARNFGDQVDPFAPRHGGGTQGRSGLGI